MCWLCDCAECCADWDEDAPLRIPDELATKPDDWSEDTPLMIPDPEAEQPASE
jgi:Calreticulin family